MVNEISINSQRKDRLSDFAKSIVETAHYPRSKRGYLDLVKITGSAEELPCSTQDRYYRFECSFVRTYKGQDNQFVKPCTYGVICIYDGGKFHEEDCINNNLRLIQEAINKINPNIKSSIEGRVLVVESVFHTLTKDFIIANVSNGSA